MRVSKTSIDTSIDNLKRASIRGKIFSTVLITSSEKKISLLSTLYLLLATFNNKMPENLRYILTLTTLCFITASLLSGVYLLTEPRILEQKEQEAVQALKEVLPEAGYFEPVVQHGKIVYFKAYLSSERKRLLGYALKAQAQGYAGLIETMAGMDTQGRITGIKVLAQDETPGLGAEIGKPWFGAQFKGKKVKDLVVAETPAEKNIQAITGATISSQALTDSVREKAKEILNKSRE